jgi:parvulin-like peptidyl-prolyl isomerase
MEEFETIAFSMGEKEISPVFNTQLGFHICTVLGRKVSEPMPFEMVKDSVRQRMIEEFKDTKFNEFVEQLKPVPKSRIPTPLTKTVVVGIDLVPAILLNVFGSMLA